MQNTISFGCHDSSHDPRTVTSDDVAKAGVVPPVSGKINMEVPSTNDLCNQQLLGICTACSVRNGAEHHFKDGVRLDKYWHYLIQKTKIDKNLWEGSSIFNGLKSARTFGIPTRAIRDKFPLFITGTYAQFVYHFNTTYGGVVPQEVLDDASTHIIAGYYSVAVDPVAIAREITNDHVVMCRFTVGDNTYKSASGVVSWSVNDLQLLRTPVAIDGGHAWDITEYEGLDWNQINRILNSWSKAWCDAGYIKFNMNTQKGFFTEAWVISDEPLPPKPFKFLNNLSFGMKHADVKQLQKFLNTNGFPVASQGAGSLGNETESFGSLTKLAVIKFQKANNISPAIGNVFEITRGVINKILGV